MIWYGKRGPIRTRESLIIPGLNMGGRSEAFKMADAESGEGYFESIPREFRKCKVNDMAGVIARFSKFSLPLWCHLSWDDYRDTVRGKVHPKIDSPYAILFYQMMRGAHEHQIRVNGLNPDIGFHKVDFIFDEQGQVGLRAVQWYSALARRLPEPHKSMAGDFPIFRDDEKVVALQAADMLAWHVRRNLEFPEEHRPIFGEITKNAIVGELKITKQTLAKFVETSKMIDPKELEDSC